MSSGGGPGRFSPTANGSLDRKVVLVDPGHNGGNAGALSIINRLIWNGRESETCDTTGTQTDSGYTEAQFNWNVARYLTADLRAEGATVVLTRTSNTGVGPCVTQRAAIGNVAHANAGVSIHADGGPANGRGFAILEPVDDATNAAVVGPSAILGADLRSAIAAGTGEPVSSYDGVNGIQPRNDLAGINLSTIPKVFVECANMRNAADASLVTSPAWQAKAARAITTGLTHFLNGRQGLFPLLRRARTEVGLGDSLAAAQRWLRDSTDGRSFADIADWGAYTYVGGMTAPGSMQNGSRTGYARD
jgi:N-acetylmuramoyl-L-alanine amidase